MKKGLFIAFKVITTIILIFGGLITLACVKLSGFSIGPWKVSAEQVRMVVTTASDYFFWVYVVIIIYLIWKKRIKK